jgi:hypothetical protein
MADRARRDLRFAAATSRSIDRHQHKRKAIAVSDSEYYGLGDAASDVVSVDIA